MGNNAIGAAHNFILPNIQYSNNEAQPTKQADEFVFDSEKDWSTNAADAIGIAFSNMDDFLAEFQSSQYGE